MLTHQVPTAATRHLSWPKAFIKSLLATSLCVIVLGVVFLPREIDRLQSSPIRRVDFCVPLPDGKSVLSLVSTIDHDQLTSGIKRHIQRYDLGHTANTTNYVCRSLNANCFALDPSGARLFIGSQYGSLYVASLDTHSEDDEILLGHMAKGIPVRMECTKDGKSLIVQDKYSLNVWSMDSGRGEDGNLRWYMPDPSIVCFATYPDSQTGIYSRSAYNENTSQLMEFNMQTGEVQPILASIAAKIKRITISVDGQFLAGIADDGQVVLLHRHSTLEPWRRRSLPGLRTGVTCIASFSPNANMLITSDLARLKLIVWNLERQEIVREFKELPHELLGCEFLDDEQFLSWSKHDTMQVWKLQSPSPVREIKL